MKIEKRVVTVGDLKRELSAYPDHYEISFGGLDFYRLKPCGDNKVHVEFNQPVYLDREDRVEVDNL